MRIPAWYLLLLAVLGILSCCQSLRVLKRFAIHHHSVLTDALGLELRRPPSDSAFRYFFRQVDVTALCAAIGDWTLAQIPSDAADIDRLICDGKTFRGSIEPHSRRRLSVHCQGDDLLRCPGRGGQPGLLHHRREPRAGGSTAAARRIGSRRGPDPSRRAPHAETVFRHLQKQGADFLLTVKANPRSLHRQIGCQFQGNRKIPFMAMDHELRHGLDITWMLRAKGHRSTSARTGSAPAGSRM